MKYVYSAIFTKLENDEYSVEIPDLPGCITCGYGLAETIFMASDAMAMWLWDAENKKENIPKSKKRYCVKTYFNDNRTFFIYRCFSAHDIYRGQ